MSPNLKSLSRRLHHPANLSEDYLRVIEELAATRDPGAIRVLVTVFDSPGIVGRMAAKAVFGFGAAAEPRMRRCLESFDEDVVRNAHRVLAALGDKRSLAMLCAPCWADADEPGSPSRVFDEDLELDVAE